MAKLMAAAAQFNLDILGPLPEDTDTTDRAGDALQQTVDRTRAQHVAAVNAGDVDAATSLFAPDAVFLPPGSPALEGTAAIRTWFTQVFGGFRIKDFSLQPSGAEPGGDVILEYGSWKATFQPKDGSPDLPAGGLTSPSTPARPMAVC